MKRLLAISALCIIPSCQFALCYVDTSSRIEHVLRDGESETAHYKLIEAKVNKDEILAIYHEDAAPRYYLPVRMKVATSPLPVFYYDCTRGTRAPKRHYETLTEVREVYVPLRVTSQEVCEKLKSFGVDTIPYGRRKFLSTAGYERHLQSEPLSVFGGTQKRIPIPHLSRLLGDDISVVAMFYYGEESLPVAGLVQLTNIVVDIPASVAGTVLALLYENSLGHLFHSDLVTREPSDSDAVDDKDRESKASVSPQDSQALSSLQIKKVQAIFVEIGGGDKELDFDYLQNPYVN